MQVHLRPSRDHAMGRRQDESEISHV
jgi:hypothetical protein